MSPILYFERCLDSNPQARYQLSHPSPSRVKWISICNRFFRSVSILLGMNYLCKTHAGNVIKMFTFVFGIRPLHSTFLKEKLQHFYVLVPRSLPERKKEYLSCAVEPVSELARLVYPDTEWFSRYGSGFLTRIRPVWHKKAVIQDVSGSWFLSIRDLGSLILQQQQMRREKLFVALPFLKPQISQN